MLFHVKTTSKPNLMNKEYANPCYLFHARRAGKGGSRFYDVGEFDGFAFVALDTRQIAYLPFTQELKKTVILRDRRVVYRLNTANTAPFIDEFPIQRFLSGDIAPWSNPRQVLTDDERIRRRRESVRICRIGRLREKATQEAA